MACSGAALHKTNHRLQSFIEVIPGQGFADGQQHAPGGRIEIEPQQCLNRVECLGVIILQQRTQLRKLSTCKRRTGV